MADDKYEAPPETPHFTSDDASDAGPEDKPSVAPDLGSPLPEPEESAIEYHEIEDEITKTAIQGGHN